MPNVCLGAPKLSGRLNRYAAGGQVGARHDLRKLVAGVLAKERPGQERKLIRVGVKRLGMVTEEKIARLDRALMAGIEPVAKGEPAALTRVLIEVGARTPEQHRRSRLAQDAVGRRRAACHPRPNVVGLGEPGPALRPAVSPART